MPYRSAVVLLDGRILEDREQVGVAVGGVEMLLSLGMVDRQLVGQLGTARHRYWRVRDGRCCSMDDLEESPGAVVALTVGWDFRPF